jgi:hypothetical protein
MAAKYTETRIPFAKMSFTPDVPATALGPNEYNRGQNVETDVRGIRSVSGDQVILNTVPGTPTFVTGNYRADDLFWFVVATVEGKWWASHGNAWQDITPGGGTLSGYTLATNIVATWNGTIPFVNDSINPPMFWPDGAGAELILYSNEVKPLTITNIATVNSTTQRITFTDTVLAAPYAGGEQILISGVDQFYNGTYTVVSSTTTTIDYLASPGGAYSYSSGQQVSPIYTWNYNPQWKSYYAAFCRIYNTPNVGSILIAGNLTVTNLDDTISLYPVTIQWSQAFGLNQAPLTWTPTITNVANQLEVPLRGPAIDGFPCGGNFFLCSYWDTVVFSPLNYSTTSAPILGVRQFTQGRGLLSSNCWAQVDDKVYGVDARDIWVFDGQTFVGIGNQRIKNYFYDNLNPAFVDRVWVTNNTEKNQVEIYYPDLTVTNGTCNQMISYRYDLDIWNPPRAMQNATFSTESPIWTYNGTSWVANYGSRCIVYAPGVTNQKLIQKDQGYSFSGANIDSSFTRDNIKMLPDYSGKLLVHRILPEVENLDPRGLPVTSTGNVTITISGSNSVGSQPSSITPVTIPVDANGTAGSNPWAQINQNAFRVNGLTISNSSNSDIWMCNASTWQYTQTEDDR